MPVIILVPSGSGRRWSKFLRAAYAPAGGESTMTGRGRCSLMVRRRPAEQYQAPMEWPQDNPCRGDAVITNQFIQKPKHRVEHFSWMRAHTASAFALLW